AAIEGQHVLVHFLVDPALASLGTNEEAATVPPGGGRGAVVVALAQRRRGDRRRGGLRLAGGLALAVLVPCGRDLGLGGLGPAGEQQRQGEKHRTVHGSPCVCGPRIHAAREAGMATAGRAAEGNHAAQGAPCWSHGARAAGTRYII